MDRSWRTDMPRERGTQLLRKILVCHLLRELCLRLRFAAAGDAEQDLGDPPHLDFLGAFGDSVAAMVAKDVLEGLMARVADRAVHLHRTVGGITDQTIRSIVAHCDLVGELDCDVR